MILIYGICFLVGLILSFFDDEKSSKGIAGTFMLGISLTLIGSDLKDYDIVIMYILYILSAIFYILAYCRYKKRESFLEISLQHKEDCFLSLSSNNEYRKRNSNEIYGDDIALDTKESNQCPNNMPRGTWSFDNKQPNESLYVKEMFDNIIMDSYATQRDVIISQYKRTFLVYLFICFCYAEPYIFGTKQDFNLFSCLLFSLLSLIAYKILFYYPNKMFKARFKIDGHIDAYTHLRDSPNSPLRLIDDAHKMKQDYEILETKYNTLLSKSNKLYDAFCAEKKNKQQLEQEISDLKKENHELALKLIKLTTTDTNKKTLSSSYDDSEPIDW